MSRKPAKHNNRWRHHLRVRKRVLDTPFKFFARSLSAQIHFLGALLSFIFLIVGIYLASAHSIGAVVSVSVFALSAILLFLSSGVMHLLVEGFRVSSRFELLLENLDKSSIYFLISGTYTAVVVGCIEYPKNAYIIAAVWSLTIFGIIYTFFQTKLHRYLNNRFVSTGQFLLMGWIVLFFMNDLIANAPRLQLRLFFGGGILYSLGAVVYALKKPNLTKVFGYHELWHTFVVVGCLCFFAGVLLFYY